MITTVNTEKLNSVLIIEDIYDDVFFLKRILNRTNLTESVHVCRDGSTAMEFLLEKSLEAASGKFAAIPDLIFLDLRLPGMDGWDFLNAYSSLSSLSHEKTKLVIVTNSLNLGDQARALASGLVDSYLMKPVEEQEFRKVIMGLFPDRFS